VLTVSQFKVIFFDRAISVAVDRGAKRGLSRFGAFVRTRDKTSLKYRKKASEPGRPPSVHRSTGFTREKTNRKTGAVSRQPVSPLRELTFFGYDADRKSVVIGAAIFPRSKAGPGVVPERIEYGGQVTLRVPVPRGTGRKATPAQGRAYQRLIKDGRITPPPREYRTVSFVARPRPHINPAFRAELPKLAGFLKDAIR
jgi:hypothetical protein